MMQSAAIVSSLSLASEAVSPQGIAVPLLLAQVRNTVPFIFDEGFCDASTNFTETYYLTRLRHGGYDASYLQYFDLCLSAHHATVASFVPTDVDPHIRYKLWHPSAGTETLTQMAERVMESYLWKTTLVSKRWIVSPVSGDVLSGHQGEWLSTAAAAYGALRRRAPELASEMGAQVVREIQKEAQIFLDFQRAKDGIGILKAATLIAHNLGDFDRVCDEWSLADDDPLKMAAYQGGVLQKSSFTEVLLKAGALNTATIATENHRHFALRVPRCLRQSVDHLLPVGPFFDDWGAQLARHPGLSLEALGTVIHALVEGWQRLDGPVGYARALAGILDHFPGGMKELVHYVPKKAFNLLKAGPLRALYTIPQKKFEAQWRLLGLRR
jgi:hypothetical protein